jgi:hypothetical protein
MANMEHAALFDRAHAAGMAAGEAAKPMPMVVVQHANPLDDSSPVVRQYAPVMDGICGSAYVVVRPGTCSFARWLKANKGAYKAYYGGMQMGVHHFGQSYERKMAYAQAFCGVLEQAGIKAYTDSWIN